MSPKSSKKRPKIKGPPPAPTKIPRSHAGPSENNYPISWHVSLMETVDPFGWHVIQREKLEEVRTKLASFENKTWHEIFVQDNWRNHSIPVSDLCKEAQDRLKEIKQDDIDSLVSLRLAGTERIWGIRDRHIFKILWWDPDHEICPALKKHT
ncbi:MAG: hypothetical protein HQK60_17420 [Deltaproteobacteria bacterium]|nr:hypothetical protein [Deltaproteobacteria bacterium]